MDFGFISVYIDDFTPCLKDNVTGELVDTEVIRIKRSSFLEKYNKKNGWYIDWSQLTKNSEVYALVIKGTVDIQGLVSVQNNPDAGALYIQWMCTAPQNNKQLTDTPKYSGVVCMLHQFHFGIFDDQMKNIMEVYTYEWTDEQL